MVQPTVHGIQSEGVVANVKHYVDNNQENNRNGVDVQVDERTQWELYSNPPPSPLATCFPKMVFL
jgi:beta-glucosidase